MANNFLGLAFTSALFSKKIKAVSKRGAATAALSAAFLSGFGFSDAGTASAVNFYSEDPIEQRLLSSGGRSAQKLVSNVPAGSGLVRSLLSLGSAAIGNVVDTVQSFASPIGSLGYAIKQIGDLWWMYKASGFQDTAMSYVQPKRDPLEGVGVFEFYQKYDELLDLVFVGQERPMQKFRSYIPNILGNRGKIANLIHCFGPSGAGKNLFLYKVLIPLLCGSSVDPLVINADFFDTDDVANADSIKQQLLGYRKFGDRMVPSLLLRYVKNNPYGVVVFNELDKAKDKNGVCVLTKIEEVLRTILDDGTYTAVDGTVYDFRGLTICITTNEAEECVNNVNNFADVDLSKVKDSSGSRTIVKHDKSFLNRPNLFTLPFDDLTPKDYVEIAAREFKDLANTIKPQYGIHILYEGNFEKVCYLIAREAVKLNKGGRAVTPIVGELNSKLVRYVQGVIDESRRREGSIRRNLVQGKKISRRDHKLLKIFDKVSMNEYNNFQLDLEIDYDPQRGFFVKEHEVSPQRNEVPALSSDPSQVAQKDEKPSGHDLSKSGNEGDLNDGSVGPRGPREPALSVQDVVNEPRRMADPGRQDGVNKNENLENPLKVPAEPSDDDNGPTAISDLGGGGSKEPVVLDEEPGPMGVVQ